MAQLTWLQQTLCTVADVQMRVPAMNVPLNIYSKTQDNDVAVRLTKLIAGPVKTIMLMDLQNEFQKRFPASMEQLIASHQYKLSRLRERAIKQESFRGDNDLVPPPGQVPISQTSMDIITQQYTQPMLYFIIRPPISGPTGDYVTTAVNGDFLVDTKAAVMYVNRSTAANSPLWQTFNYSDMKDYILDGTVLNMWATSLTIQQSLLSGMFADDMGDKVAYIDKMYKTIDAIVSADRNRALSNINIDYSGNGSMLDYGNTRFNDNWYVK